MTTYTFGQKQMDCWERQQKAAIDILAALKEVREMLWARPDIAAKLRPLMGPAEHTIANRAQAAIAAAEAAGIRVQAERDPFIDPTKEGIFRDHTCAYCRDGELPCRQGHPNRCDFPRARND